MGRPAINKLGGSLVRKLFVVVGIIGIAVPLLAQAPAGDQGSGGRGGAQPPLGPVGGLGQMVKRPPVDTRPTPQLPDGTVDLNGLWTGGGPTDDIKVGLPKGETLPLLPSAIKVMEERATRLTDDPHLWCMPMGVPRSVPYPFRFVQNYTDRKPTHMFILHEGNIHSYRQIFMDGRKHPAELDPTWFGHSIGWFEGNDTLVIDTVGYNDKFWFDRLGTPHTEQLHTIERWRRTNMGTLVNTVTIDDPGAYSRPFTLTFTALLNAPGDDLMENICQENNQYGVAGGHQNPFNK